MYWWCLCINSTYSHPVSCCWCPRTHHRDQQTCDSDVWVVILIFPLYHWRLVFGSTSDGRKCFLSHSKNVLKRPVAASDVWTASIKYRNQSIYGPKPQMYFGRILVTLVLCVFFSFESRTLWTLLFSKFNFCRPDWWALTVWNLCGIWGFWE